ncbi:MAG: helicase [Planctomycetes bacterium]|nr:helicase [Planctomycetota bacterium]
MRRIPYVIDNDQHTMADVLNQVLEDHHELAMDIATAYFNVRGYGLLRDRLNDLGSLRLLIGAEPQTAQDVGLKPTAAAIQAALRGDLSAEPYRPETLKLVEDLIRFLNKNEVQVRLYVERFLHAKCYLFYGDPKGGPLFDRFRPVLGIVGSSNFTGPGLSTNRELNLVHKGIIPEDEVDDEKARMAALSHYGDKDTPTDIEDDPYEGGKKPRVSKAISFESKRVIKGEVGASAIWELAEWFDHQWSLSRDYKQDLIDLLDTSKFGTKEYTPYEVYLKALFEHFRADLEAAGGVPADLYSLNLAEFQTDAVARARRILAKYDGVMVCDSVGLGKTWIALQLLLDVAYHKRWHALVICPASLRDMWEASKRTTKMHFDILGQEAIGREEFDVEPYGKYDFIVVDESHNFRNNLSGRFLNLSRLMALNGGRGEHGYRKKIVLLTATPINNSIMDLHSQLQFITRGDNAFFAGAGIGRLDKYFWNARKKLLAGTGSAGRALYNLLDEIVIRRTRRFIRKAYPDATINGKKVHFPKRKLVTVRYDLEGTYAGIYEQIVRTIEHLKLAPYDLESYKADPDERDKIVMQRGQNLVGIFKSRYLKRLESSVAAFRISLFRSMEYLLTFRHYILDNVLLEPSDFWKLLGTVEKDLEDDAQAQESEGEEDDDASEQRPRSRHKGIEASDKATRLLKKAARLPAGTYDLQKLNDALDADLTALDTIFDLVRPIKPKQDKKLIKIKELLTNDLAGKKVLVFTSFKDTAKYLYEEMGEDADYLERLGGRKIRVIHGGSDGKTRLRLVQAFAPKSNDKKEWAGTDKEVDILISTDVLSEGQNLQDCAYLLNYDLHWNPTRMIQRAGRIDRIGTDFDKLFIRNFFPDAGLERLLGLVRSLRAKIETIDATVGLDASVLGEAINPKVFNTLKRIEGEDETVIDEEEAEAELASDEGLVRHLAEYMRISGNELLNTLPDGIHSGLHKRDHRGVFLYYQRRGRSPDETEHFWRYYDFATGEIEDNRLAIAELIRCKPDEARIVDPALKSDIHAIMERVEEQIVQAAKHQETVSAAPKELSSDQSSVVVALQQAMNAPGVERKHVMRVLGMLARPMHRAPVKELKKSLAQYQKDGDTAAFITACEEIGTRYAEQPAPTTADDGSERRKPLGRDDLHLICFDFLS